MKTLAATAAAVLLLAACGGSSDEVAPNVDTPAAIATYLDGKTMTMTGADIPSHPNGFNENQNFGASTQCYVSVGMSVAAGTWSVVSQLGTLSGAPTAGSIGTCDNAAALGNPLTFSSAAVLIENVAANGTCFDFTITYTGFSQEGRGAFSADRKTLQLELFFGGQATGHRCAGGAVGQAGTVTLNGLAFTGNAVQTYRIP
ncbi:MAG: hypothetical protein IPO09_17920 [Anaeromyxobacter sp.]|nr:hypothetical protein [Anaeromyxobacter sp.]MBL0276422.1 hypothetical protein [Anaeromyxobacter sp.]